MKRITATQAARSFSRVLDEAEHSGESFVIERNGRPVAELRPAARRSTVADAIEALCSAPAPDAELERDMREIIEDSRRDYPVDRWPEADG